MQFHADVTSAVIIGAILQRRHDIIVTSRTHVITTPSHKRPVLFRNAQSDAALTSLNVSVQLLYFHQRQPSILACSLATNATVINADAIDATDDVITDALQ